MKLAFTLNDAGAAAHVGGDVDRVTYIVELPDDSLPERIKWARKLINECPPGKSSWLTITISEVKEVGCE